MRQVYDVVELDQIAEGDQIQAALKDITGIRTVMQTKHFYLNQLKLLRWVLYLTLVRFLKFLLRVTALEVELVNTFNSSNRILPALFAEFLFSIRHSEPV